MENKGSWLNASPWRRTHMAEAEARVERKERDEEAGMSRQALLSLNPRARARYRMRPVCTRSRSAPEYSLKRALREP